MNKMMVMATALLVGAFAFGENQSNELVRVGGKGKVAFVNTCNAPTESLKKAMKETSRIMMIDLELKEGAWSLADAQKSFDAVKANTAIFLIKDKSLPISLIAMESKWGVVNTEGLDDKCVMKEAMRVAVILMGGAASRFPASMMRPVFSKEDLATKAGECLTFDTVMPMDNYLPGLGIEPYRVMTREDAIAEGLLKK